MIVIHILMYPAVKDSTERGLVFSKYSFFFSFYFFLYWGIPIVQTLLVFCCIASYCALIVNRLSKNREEEEENEQH